MSDSEPSVIERPPRAGEMSGCLTLGEDACDEGLNVASMGSQSWETPETKRSVLNFGNLVLENP